MKTPRQFFNDGYNAGTVGLPETACQLQYDAWPYQCWLLGFKLAKIEAEVFNGDWDNKPLVPLPKSSYDQGVVAFAKGLTIDACPYEMESKDYRSFCLGWQQASFDRLNRFEKPPKNYRLGLVLCAGSVLTFIAAAIGIALTYR